MQNLVLTLLVVVNAGLISNSNELESKVEGTYSYIASNENMFEDFTGMIQITKSDAKYKVVISPDEGTVTNLTGVKVSENFVTGTMKIQGYEIKISMKIEKDAITGTAVMPDGNELKITAKRKKK
jgi:hypothetical protein